MNGLIRWTGGLDGFHLEGIPWDAAQLVLSATSLGFLGVYFRHRRRLWLNISALMLLALPNLDLISANLGIGGILGIAIAVSVLIIVLSVVNGFERELKDRLLAMTAHASIEGVEGELEGWQDLQATAAGNPRVTASAPYVAGQALMVFGEQLSGGELRGIDPEQEHGVSGVASLGTSIFKISTPGGNPPASTI